MPKLPKFGWKELIESVKEPLRLVIFGVVSYLITYFSGIDVQWAIVLTGVLRLVDSILHEYGKVKENSLVTGLTRF
uniref:Holin n=1 Tax=viral metagenome TaxID=1070528 RepID=A0A6M3L0A4_9ZZZZ